MWIVRSLSSRWCKGGTEISLSRTRVCWLLYYQFDSNMWTGPSSLSDDNAVVLPSTCRASLELTVMAACWYQWRLTESLCLHSPSSSLSLSCYLCHRNAPFHSSDADVWPEKVDLGIGDENLANFVNNLKLWGGKEDCIEYCIQYQQGTGRKRIQVGRGMLEMHNRAAAG